MKMIKTTDWKKFKVSELFLIEPTKYYKDKNKVYINNDLFSENGVNPVIVNSKFNNGVGGYSFLENTEKGNIITYSDTTSSDTIFYQNKDFIGYPHIQGLYPLKDNNEWEENSYLFLITILRKEANRLSIDYNNKFTREIFSNMEIILPVDSNDKIDFKYMKNYIKNLRNNINSYIEKLEKNDMNFKKVDSKTWKRFELYDDNLFFIESGNKLDYKNMLENNPEVLFISRSKKNNGVKSRVNKIEGIVPYKKGNLTLALGGSIGSCFIQNEDFYTSQNIVVLIPKWDMSENIKQFISTVIFREAQQYYVAFKDELNRHINTDFSILLPVDNKEKPDWEYIENYMENIKIEIENKITKILTFQKV